MNHPQHHLSLSLWLSCWPNQSGKIWCGPRIPLPWAVRIVNVIVLLSIRFDVYCSSVITGIWIMQVASPAKPISGVRNAFRWAILITINWWRLIRLTQQTYNIWGHPPGRSVEDKAGGKSDPSDNLNAAAPWCWEMTGMLWRSLLCLNCILQLLFDIINRKILSV